MSDQRSVTPFEQKVFDLISRENPPHPVILSQLVASMNLRYITRFRSSIDGERTNMLLCAAAEMHSAATDALANSTSKMNEEASDAAPRSSSGNASFSKIEATNECAPPVEGTPSSKIEAAAESAPPVESTSSVESAPALHSVSPVETAPPVKIHNVGRTFKPVARLPVKSQISFENDPEDERLYKAVRPGPQAGLSGTTPSAHKYQPSAIDASNSVTNGGKDAMRKQGGRKMSSGEQDVGKKEVQNQHHATFSPHRSLEELDAELEKMQSEAAKVATKSEEHPFFGRRSAQGL